MRSLLLLAVTILSLGCSRDGEATSARSGKTLGEPTGHSAGEPSIRHIPVSSSFIDSVGYDPATQILEIEMNSGRNLYRYFAVPQSTFEGMLRAPSKGRYFNASIKGIYRYQRIR